MEPHPLCRHREASLFDVSVVGLETNERSRPEREKSGGRQQWSGQEEVGGLRDSADERAWV